MYILDTDHVSLWLENNPAVRSKIAEFDTDLAITIITVQELFNGWVGRLNDPAQANQQVMLYAKLSKVIALLRGCFKSLRIFYIRPLNPPFWGT